MQQSEPAPNLKLEGALFLLDLAGEATLDGDEAVTTPGRPSQRKGIELSGSYKPLSWFRLDGDFADQIDYLYPSQLANERAPVYDIHFKPIEPISARLTLSMTF